MLIIYIFHSSGRYAPMPPLTILTLLGYPNPNIFLILLFILSSAVLFWCQPSSLMLLKSVNPVLFCGVLYNMSLTCFALLAWQPLSLPLAPQSSAESSVEVAVVIELASPSLSQLKSLKMASKYMSYVIDTTYERDKVSIQI